MIRAMLVDDEPNCNEALELLLGKYCPDIQVVKACTGGEEALAVLRSVKPQLVFLDIEMPHIDGFRFLEKAGDISFQVIFITSYDQYAIRAIRTSALDYLLKPVDRNELVAAVDRVAARLPGATTEQLAMLLEHIRTPHAQLRRIAVPTMDGLQMISVDEIVSCSSESNYTHLLLRQGKKLTASRTMKDVEELLKDHGFLRVHHSYLVNLNEVRKYVKGEGGYLEMSDGSTVDVSRSRKEILLRYLQPDRS